MIGDECISINSLVNHIQKQYQYYNMNIKVLTAEESKEYWEREKEERKKWPTEFIIKEAKFMMSLPDMGNTKYLLPYQYEEFYEWLETDEAREQWYKMPHTIDLAKYYLETKTK